MAPFIDKFLGIDPGATGAMALLVDGPAAPLQFYTCRHDQTEHDLAAWLSTYAGIITIAVIENVHSMPKQGVKATFTFGRNYGFLRGLLIAFKIPFEEVTPQRWQQVMGCRSHGDKRVTRARAQQLFPQEKVIHQTADAMLLAEYARRQWYAGHRQAAAG